MKPEGPATSYDAAISGHGLRLTDQRRAVFDSLMAQRDHPTAVEVFVRVKTRMPSISLATVYNCLETLTDCGLVRHVHHNRQPSRYCANLAEHAHFFCENCGSVTDLPVRSRKSAADVWSVPEDIVITQQEVSFRGLCQACVASAPDPQEPVPGRKRASRVSNI